MLLRRGTLYLTPKRRLPIVAFTSVPIQNHPRAKDQILIEDVRDFPGEFVSPELAAFARQITGNGIEARVWRQSRQQFHNPPGHRVTPINFRARTFRERRLEETVEKILWKEKTHIRANAMVSSNLLDQPPLHPIALDHDNLRRKWFAKRLGQNLGELVSENLKAVTGIERKTSGHGLYIKKRGGFRA